MSTEPKHKITEYDHTFVSASLGNFLTPTWKLFVDTDVLSGREKATWE